MKAFEKAFAAALLCGAVSFVLPSQAAQTANTGTSQATGNTSDAANAAAEKPKAEASEAKKVVRHRVAVRISPKENAKTADLNKQSLQAVESGNTTPTFTEATPPNNQQVVQGETGKKTGVKTRLRRSKISTKKPTG